MIDRVRPFLAGIVSAARPLAKRALVATVGERAVRRLRRRLGMSPVAEVMDEVARRGLPLADADALEVFGGRGDWVIPEYIDRVRSLTIWEFEPSHVAQLRSKFPIARQILQCDSFEQVRTTSERFDVIVADSAIHTSPPHFESFDLFPHIWLLLRSPGALVLNVAPTAPEASDEQLEARRRFYEVGAGNDIPMKAITSRYVRSAQEAGLTVDWTLLRRRSWVWLLALGTHRQPSEV